MLLIDEFKHIKNRADFFVALEDAIQRSQALTQAGSVPAEDSILLQLQSIQEWTATVGSQPKKNAGSRTSWCD